MTDNPHLRGLFRISAAEFVVAIAALVGVITLGAVTGILLAGVLALLPVRPTNVSNRMGHARRNSRNALISRSEKISGPPRRRRGS